MFWDDPGNRDPLRPGYAGIVGGGGKGRTGGCGTGVDADVGLLFNHPDFLIGY